VHLDTTNVATGTVIRITEGAHHIRIQNCEITSTNQRDAQGILADGTGHEFLNNHIHHVANSHYVHGIYLSGDNALIQGNHIHHVNGYGIHIFNSTDGVSAHHNRVIGNRVHDTGSASRGATAILLSSGVGNVAYNNLVYNNRRGIEANYGAHEAVIVYNTIVGNQGGEPPFGLGVWSRGVTVHNNVTVQNDHDYTDKGEGTTRGENMGGGDPRFVNAGSGHFHVQDGRKAIGTPSQ
jgi:hypothetical protein